MRPGIISKLVSGFLFLLAPLALPVSGGVAEEAGRNPAAAEVATTALLGQLGEIDDGYLHRNEKGRLENSTEELKRLIDPQKPDPVLLWRLGRNLLALADREQGKKEKLAVEKQAKKDKLAALGEAATALKQAVELAAQYPQAHFWLAQEMGAENEIRQTLHLARSMKKELETTLQLDPRYAQAHCVYGELLRQLPGIFGGSKDRAVKENEEALRLAPNDTANYPALAEAYRAVKRKEDAIRVLNKIFDVREPSDPGAYEDDLKEARDLLRHLTESNP